MGIPSCRSLLPFLLWSLKIEIGNYTRVLYPFCPVRQLEGNDKGPKTEWPMG